MHYVETKDVVKQFSQHLALNKVSIRIPARRARFI